MKQRETAPIEVWDQWLNTATKQISFAPDRSDVARELRDHLEDKAATLGEVFPQLAQQEVEGMALNQMGQAEELAPVLAKIHRPWLGYVWLATRIMVGMLLVPLVIQLFMVLVLAIKIF